MALERGRPASSIDRALQDWRREATQARKTIAALRDHLAEVIGENGRLRIANDAVSEELADTIAERESLMRDLETARHDLSQLENRHHELRLEHQIIVGLIRATESRKAAGK